MKKVIGLAVIAVASLFISDSAWAVVYKNFAHGFSQGEFFVGLSVEAMSRDFEDEAGGEAELDIDRNTLNVGIGVGQSGLIGLHAGAVDIGSDDPNVNQSDGGEFGVSYTHNLDPNSEGPVQLGFQLSLRTGTVDEEFTETDFTQVDLGFGGALKLNEQLSFYFGGVFSSVDATIELTVQPFSAFDIEASDNIGGFGGIEFRASEQFLLGAEIHLLHESGIAIYGDILF